MSNIEALQAKLPDEACGALITSDVSRRYFCGFKSSAGVILVTKEQSYLIIDSRYFDKAKQRVTDCRVILLEDMRTQLSELLLKHDIRRLMLESDYMTLSEFAAYKEQLHFVELDATSWLSDFIWGMRIIKTAEEVKLIVKAQRIAEKAFERLVDNIHRDMTEKQVAALLNYYMMDLGADDLSFETIAASGVNSASPHAVPTDKKLQEGDFLTLDFGAVVDSCSLLLEYLTICTEEGIISAKKAGIWTKKVTDVKYPAMKWLTSERGRAEKLRAEAERKRLTEQAAALKAVLYPEP